MGNSCHTFDRESMNIDKIEVQLQKNQDFHNILGKNNVKHSQIKSQSKIQQSKQAGKSNFLEKIFKQKSPSKITSRQISQLKSTILQLFPKCKASYAEHYIDEAAEKAHQIQFFVNQAKNKQISIDLTENDLVFLKQVINQHQDVLYYEKQIQRGGWDLKSDKNGMKIWCRRQPDGTVGCRIQAITDVPFEVLISVMIQMEYYKDYTPFTEISKQEKEIARNCRIGYTLNNVPFITKRQAYFQGVGYSRLNHESKQLFLFTRSLHDKQNLQQSLNFPISINQKYIQLDYKYFVVRYRPIKKDVGLLDMAMNVDAKIDFVPTWLMQMVAKDFGEKFFKNIVRISKNFKGSKWEKNVQNNPALFLYFQKQVKNYLAKIQKN